MKKTKHQVITGRLRNDKIERAFWAGEAYYYPDEGYFELTIPLFDSPWYLSANQNPKTYTIFKEKVLVDGKLSFKRPIGKASVADRFNTYLKICVPLWNPSYQPYLSLFPS